MGGRLEGKIAIVTGAGSGFGAAISLAFIAEGAKVLVCDINVAGGEATVANNPSALAFHQMDVTKPSDWDATMSAVTAKWGRCDILVNNAGWSYKNKPTDQVTEEEFQRCFDINVKGVFFGCQAWVKQAVDRKEGGVIINIASVGATRPRPGLVWYNASKGAVWNATKGLAAEYGPHKIRVVSVCPLVTATGLFSAFTGMEDSPENRAKFTSNVPLGRIGEVEDVAGVCVFLASEEARFITGVNLEVDGGRCI
ncbi:3-ketoacyl-reductase-like protein [Dothidotthia symphoricarpi CBS 119687]|uniref:3-ketoacyl-reductase-like protein n=1 Tax=Dothidotthia symphoricarpi CBS 119687 TaxID=1392245 RepID=A0A6A6A5Q0_9PLEO|nr:3-ketoacyl-reductase-like protein [Dothidotthia symphoricarpi CBS 119687]KAF2127302.1 3-ketoacyl-reductase-like protein [Dothidotthia symphoricarpi CBS 119687]